MIRVKTGKTIIRFNSYRCFMQKLEEFERQGVILDADFGAQANGANAPTCANCGDKCRWTQADTVAHLIADVPTDLCNPVQGVILDGTDYHKPVLTDLFAITSTKFPPLAGIEVLLLIYEDSSQLLVSYYEGERGLHVLPLTVGMGKELTYSGGLSVVLCHEESGVCLRDTNGNLVPHGFTRPQGEFSN